MAKANRSGARLQGCNPKDLDERFAQTSYVVEAETAVVQLLWHCWSRQAENSGGYQTKVDWDGLRSGVYITVGKIAGRLVTVQCRWANIQGKLVMFYYPSGETVAWDLVKRWLEKYCNPQTADGRRAHCDAGSFCDCVAFCRTRVSRPKPRRSKRKMRTAKGKGKKRMRTS